MQNLNPLSTPEATDTADTVVSVHGDCKVLLATQDHVEYIYPTMRKEDKIEVACMGHSPKEALETGLEYDDITFTAVDVDNVPFAMFGAGHFDNQGYIWLLGTDALEDNAYQFLRASRKYVQIMTKPYGTVINYVHTENTKAIQWLRHCSAKFIRKVNVSNQTFLEFIIISNNV